MKIILISCHFILFTLSTLNSSEASDLFKAHVTKTSEVSNKLKVEFTVPNRTILSEIRYTKTLMSDERIVSDIIEVEEFYQINSKTYFFFVDKNSISSGEYLFIIEAVTRHYNFIDWEAKFSRPRSHFFEFTIDIYN
jgi:hypothetical protein